MTILHKFIDSLIPSRFVVTYENKIKVRGALYVQLTIGTLLTFLGVYFGLFNNVWHELLLNTGMGIFLLISMFSLPLFNRFESYVNFLLTFGYIDIALFLVKAGGVYTDAPFWFVLLIAVNIFYTSTRQAFYWIAIVGLFLGIMFYLQINGLDLDYTPVPYSKKATTIFTFFTLLITIAFSFSKINKRKNNHHLEIIDKHKRLLKERDDLMSIIAHDMKSPSRRIEGLLSILDRSNLTEDQEEIINRLNNTAIENQQLIHDLIEATRFQSNIELKTINVNDIINDLQEGYLPLSSKKNIRLIIYGLNQKINIESSPHHLKRILDNLFSNAIKFSSLESRVEITCVQNKLNTSISIKDQGPGFTKEDEAGMFKMFQKLSARPTAGETSSGLGLSIVKNLTELLKGEIKYVTQVGAGSTFTLVLPNKFPQANNNNS